MINEKTETGEVNIPPRIYWGGEGWRKRRCGAWWKKQSAADGKKREKKRPPRIIFMPRRKYNGKY